MNPIDLIDVQATIADGLRTDREYVDYSALVMDTVDSVFSGVLKTEWDSRDTLDLEAGRMRGAYTFHASAEMTAIVHGASQALLEQPEPFRISFEPETLPTENGFVVFELSSGHDLLRIFDDSWPGPWEVETGDGKGSVRLPEMDVCAFSWGPVMGQAIPNSTLADVVGTGSVSGIRLTFYAPLDNHAEWLSRTLRRFNRRAEKLHARNAEWIAEALTELGMTRERLEEITTKLGDGRRQLTIPEGFSPDQVKVFLSAAQFIAEQREVESVITQSDVIQKKAASIHLDPGLRRYRLIPVLSLAYPRTGTSVDVQNSIDYDGAALLCLAWTFFHMCGQTITVSSEEKPPRAAARRWRDMPMPKRVTVVRLRRAKVVSEHEGDPNTVWHHRWMVRGHWRMQACGPGRTERRPVWIHPFVKGPEGAPLLITDKVYDLVR